ncbi:MAG TPA: hypothetical protein VGQ14_06995, partial [Candidatus Eisenbacteria bacterium]|nr:hypothetical protein [Candidatus Eisenbacteria bacterium]
MRRIGSILLAVLASLPQLASASLSPGARTATDTYIGELERVEKSKSRLSMEPLFLQAVALNDALVMPAQPGGPSPLEELSDQEYASLQGHLRGMVVNRDEIVFARPDLRFFVELGERKGIPEDRLFFHLYRMTYPKSVAPVYIEQQTDHSGCTDFGSGKLTRLYGEWNKYGLRHPKRYESVVQEETNRIVRELLEGTCACGDERSVESEFRYFL